MLVEPITPVNRLINIESIICAFTAQRDKHFVFSGEAHDYWEMVYISSGTAGIAAEEHVFECEAGTLVFHKPNEFHRIWAAGGAKMEHAVISFVEQGEYMHKLDNTVMHVSHYGEKLMKDIIRIIDGPNVDYRAEKFRHDSIAVARFSAVLELLLYDCIAFRQQQKPISGRDAALFSEAVEKMHQYISQPIKAQQIADELQISLSHLKRIFSRYMGLGVHEYFLALKMERAKMLLASGETVYNTAEAVGFYDQGYFSTAFKRETGVLPSEWRKY